MTRDIHKAYASLSEQVKGFGCAFLPQPGEPDTFLRLSIYREPHADYTPPETCEGFPVCTSFGSFLEQT